MFYSKPKSFKMVFPFLLAGLAIISMPSFSAEDESMEQMHKQMQSDRDDRMGYGMGRGSMMAPGGMGMMGPGMMDGNMSSMMMNMLDLDKKQRSEIRNIMRQHRNSHCKMMNSIMDIQDELADQYDKDKPDAKNIGKTYTRLSEQKRKMIEQSIETHNKIRDVLNKEQQQRFDYMHRRGRMMGPGGGMMGPGGMGMMH